MLDLTVTEIAPLGQQYAVFTSVEKGKLTNDDGKEVETLELTAELVGPLKSDGTPFVVRRIYRWDTRGINMFKGDLKYWRGHALDAKELRSFDPVKEFVGKGAMVRVTHSTGKGPKTARFLEFKPHQDHDVKAVALSEADPTTKKEPQP